MEKKWTAAQTAAMNITDKTLLVSAAAGSGKTATLTQRIINRLTDPEHPSDISGMLIVTFTHAAADELKNRIFLALSAELAKCPANRHLTSQLIKLGSAKICTIDAFYLDLVRQNFAQLGISPSFRIADPAELELLSDNVMEETVEFFYETDNGFSALAECLTGTRSANRLSKVLLHLSERASSLPEGVEFLHTHASQIEKSAREDMDFLSTPFGQILRAQTLDAIHHFKTVFDSAVEFACHPDFVSALLTSYVYDLDFCNLLIKNLNHPTEGYRRTQDLLNSFEPIRLKSLKNAATEESDTYKELRKDIHEKIRDIRKKSFSKSAETIRRALSETAGYTETLYRLLSEYERRMSEEKKRRNIMDFNDVRRQTLRLLVNEDGTPTEIAKQYAKEFTDIYIDEYQDVDRVQDLIFRSIAKPNNRFMVGDIKQSIYGFRGAEPSLFAQYRTDFPAADSDEAKDSDQAAIFMSENFRCDQNIIDFTNLVCGRMFSACADRIGYRAEDDDLRHAKPNPSENYRSPTVQVTVLSPSQSKDDNEETMENEELEAEYIAAEIARLIREETKADGKPIQPGDIAVLFRSRTISSYLTKALQKRGILTSESDGEKYFEAPDVLMVLCLLNTVDNPHRDIFLTGTLRSPLFGFTMDDLISIRRSADFSHSLYDALLLRMEDGNDPLAKKCRDFEQTLSEYRRLSTALPVDRFLRMLFESDIFATSGFVTAQNESGEGGNLLRLYEYARTFENGSFKGLYNFIEFINSMIEEGKKLKIPSKGVSPDRVNLMTIHKSKGLEFPVCFVCNTGARFNLADQQESLLFEYPIGVAMKLSDSTGFARINTPMRDALCTNNAVRQREEEMRVLYVALTRARERLYVTASRAGGEEKIMAEAFKNAAFCTRYSMMKCNSYLKWILLPFADPNTSTDCACLSFLDERAIAEMEQSSKPSAPADEEVRTEKVDQDLYRSLQTKYAFRYPHRDLQRIPAKLSVSRLSPDILDENDTSKDLFDRPEKTAIPDFFLGKINSRPNATERGTATHLFFQFFDISLALRHGAREELARLVEKKFIPQHVADLVYTEELEAFLQSVFAQEIQQAKRIIREQRFNLLMDSECFTANPLLRQTLQGEKMAVQGVIDLILIDREDRLCLFDYKTDRLTEAERNNPALAAEKMNRIHGLQLSYYAYAMEKLFGRPCHRICVYSTHSASLYDIAPMPLDLPKDTL